MRITHLYTDPEQLSSSKTKKAKCEDKSNGKIIKHCCMKILLCIHNYVNSCSNLMLNE